MNDKHFSSQTSHHAQSIVSSRAQSHKLPPQCVLVLGATGGIGKAFCEQVLAAFPDVLLIRMARQVDALSAIPTNSTLSSNSIDINIDLNDDHNMQQAFTQLTQALSAKSMSIDWVFIATGWLHDAHTQPEKTYRHLQREHLLHAYNINAIGPALFVSQLLQVTDKQQAIKVGILSARVGSISDNRLGGWHAYRASKAALHMLIKNIAIECKNTRRPVTIVGLQPGTTDTPLSAPFQKGLQENQLQSPAFTAEHLLQVMAALQLEDSGQLFDFEGIPFAP